MRKVIARHELPSREEMLGWIQALSDGPHRLAGTAGGRRAEDLLEKWFQEIGLPEVARETIPLESWEPVEAALSCQGEDFPAYPVSRSVFTGPEGLSAPMVFAGQSDAEEIAARDIAGKIVVAEVGFAPRPYQLLGKTAHAVHDPGGTLGKEPNTLATWILPSFARTYAWCVAGGAAGFVGILKDLKANRCRYHYPYAQAEEVLSLPAVFIGRDDGARL